MRRTRFKEEQIVQILHQGEAGRKVRDLCREHGISEQTYYRWKKKYGGLQVSEAKRLKQLEDENRRLKKLVADISLDKEALKAHTTANPEVFAAACRDRGKTCPVRALAGLRLSLC